MYVKISEIIHYFDYSEDVKYYFSLQDGEMYSEDELAEMCVPLGIFSKDSFVPITKFSCKVAAKKYIKLLNDKKLRHILQKTSDENYLDVFYRYIDDGFIQLGNWHEFKRLELSKIAVEWCENNGIKYTLN